MSWGRPSQWHPLVSVRVLAVMTILVVGSIATASTALTLRTSASATRGEVTATTTNALNPVVIGSNEPATTADTSVKVQSGDDAVQSGSADGAGQPRGYTGLFKLAGLVLFLAFAFSWWAWGGEMPARRAGGVGAS